MKFNKNRIVINIIRFYILLFYRTIYCKDFYIKDTINEISFINESITPSSILLLKEEDYKRDDFDSEVINKNINIGKVKTELLYESYIYQFNFSSNNYKGDLFVNFYPLDCQIKFAALNDDAKAITVQSITNYEYGAFSVLIKKEKIISSYIKIKPLINILEENNKKRIFHLVINCFYKDNPQLELKEKEPTLIYFDSTLEGIKLSYQSKNEPVVFSFFIKERAKFEAKVMDDENTKRIIAYKDNIIVYPNKASNINNFVYIDIKNEKNKNSTLIVKVSGNSTYPYYLQKNILNLGFMPINTFYHYYYMEVFKGERVEIMIYNKIHKGFLKCNILGKEHINETTILVSGDNYFLKDEKNSYCSFNNYYNKLDLYIEEDSCENGCYLLITYQSPEIYLKNIDGIEYNLLARIFEKDEMKSQIINIPLNEYIFGVFEGNLFKAHSYLIYIPEKDDIALEIHGKNFAFLEKAGKIRLDPINNNELDFDYYFEMNEKIEDEKLIFKIDKDKLKVKSLEGQYISFSFYKLFDDNYFPINYYFRIIQSNSDKNFIYPLDTNKENICLTSLKNYSCYFLLKNDYKELYYNYLIYAYGKGEVSYYVWYINDTEKDYYSIDLNNIEKNYAKWHYNKGYLRHQINDNTKFILIKIISELKSLEILNVFFNFDGELIQSPSVDIFSYQIFYLENNIKKNFSFNMDFSGEYELYINNIYGEGYICPIENFSVNDKKIFISYKIFLSFVLTNNIYFVSENDLLFALKIFNKVNNNKIQELHFGLNFGSKSDLNAYYLKDIYDKGLDINFYLEDNDDRSFKIYGGLINYENLKYINSEEDLNNFNRIYSDTYLGFYYLIDHRTKNGFISYINFSESELFSSNNYYFFSFYAMKGEKISCHNISVEMLVESKNDSQKILQKNKYYRGIFSLFNEDIQEQTFTIQIEKGEYVNDTYILEFSSNFEDMQLIFNDDFNFYDKRINGGVQQFFISGEKLIEFENYYFIVRINGSNIINDVPDDGNVNYILKFSNYKSGSNHDFILDKKLQFSKIKNKNYNFTIKNLKSNKNINNYYNYTYHIDLIPKKLCSDYHTLNNIAILQYEFSPNNDIFYDKYVTKDPDEEFSFSFNSFPNEDYNIILFLVIDGPNGEKSYYSNIFELSKEEDLSKNTTNKILIIIIIIITSLFIIIIILFIVFCFLFKKKNRDLKDKVLSISFSTGIEEDSLDNYTTNKINSKKEEDYENTFI